MPRIELRSVTPDNWRAVAAVEPAGAQRAAVQALAARLAAEGCDSVALSYSPGNAAAHALYRSLGFKETGEMEDDEVVARLRPSAS